MTDDEAHVLAASPLGFVPTLPAVIHRAVERFGDQEFLVMGDRRLSFREADAQSATLAKGLLAMGLGKGARIGLILPNDPDWVLTWMAAGRMGALTVTLSTLYQPRELAWALRHNDIDTLCVCADYLGHDYLARLEASLPGLAEQAGPTLYLPEFPYLRRIVVWGGCDRAWATGGPAEITARAVAVPQIDDAFLANVEAQVSPADDFVVICTSGTTAEPKAALHTHGSAIRNTWTFMPFLEMEPGDRVYNAMPLFWVGGFLRTLMPALYLGATMLFSKSTKSADALDVVVSERATFLNLGAGMTHDFGELVARTGADLSRVRRGLGARQVIDGEPIPPDRRPGGNLGMTETFGTHSACLESAPTPPGKQTHWGRPSPGVERRIVDPQTGETVGPGQRGELQVRSRNAMRGYLKREYWEAFTPDGFFATGDDCMLDEDGYLYFYGRLTEMIKTAGANVSPREVEVLMNSFAEVRESFVFGTPDPRRGEAVIAVVTPAPDAVIDTEALRARIRAEISAYKVPQEIIVMADEDIPRTDNGKPRKTVLRARVMADRTAS
jgi:acyl-CoA synthetase (AMP-forming)/AMP-acid ligase II